MAWPTGSISTANVDQGIDRPRVAREQIRQSHVDADAIADEFGTVDTTGVVDGNILGYDGTKWAPSDNLVVEAATYAASIGAGNEFDLSDTWSSGDTVSKNLTFGGKDIDRNNYLSNTNADNPTIVAGVYDIRIQGPWAFEVIRNSGTNVTGITPTISLIDTDSSTTLGSFTSKVPASLTNDLDPTANEYEHLLYTSLSLRHTFSTATAIRLRGSLTIAGSGSSGLFKIGAGLQVRFVKI